MLKLIAIAIIGAVLVALVYGAFATLDTYGLELAMWEMR